MTNDLKSRLRAARTRAAAPVEERHDQAADVPAQLADVKGTEDVAPAMDKTVMAWLARYSAEFEEALPAHIDRSSFFAAVRAILPKLARCTPASTLQALLTCAKFGLVPDEKHAVIKREGTTAVFVPMAQGFVDLMYRSGAVASVHVGEIRAGDEYSYTPTAPSPDDFVHRPDLTKSKAERGDVVLCYAFAWLRGGARSQVIILSREDAEAIRDEYSAAYQAAKAEGRTDSFWHTHFLDMWRKSCVRRLAKVVPMSAELVALVKTDDAGRPGRCRCCTPRTRRMPASSPRRRRPLRPLRRRRTCPPTPSPAGCL